MFTLIPSNKALLLKQTYCGAIFEKKEKSKNESFSQRQTMPLSPLSKIETAINPTPNEIKSPVREYVFKMNVGKKMMKSKEEPKCEIDYELVLNRLKSPEKIEKE
jgi:hypothetical protein